MLALYLKKKKKRIQSRAGDVAAPA
jgi:hypothetical protein